MCIYKIITTRIRIELCFYERGVLPCSYMYIADQITNDQLVIYAGNKICINKIVNL